MLAIMLLFHILLCMDHILNTAAFTLPKGTNRGTRLAHALENCRFEDAIYGGASTTADPNVAVFRDPPHYHKSKNILFNGTLSGLKHWCTDYEGQILVRMRAKGYRSFEATFDIKGF